PGAAERAAPPVEEQRLERVPAVVEEVALQRRQLVHARREDRAPGDIRPSPTPGEEGRIDRGYEGVNAEGEEAEGRPHCEVAADERRRRREPCAACPPSQTRHPRRQEH